MQLIQKVRIVHQFAGKIYSRIRVTNERTRKDGYLQIRSG